MSAPVSLSPVPGRLGPALAPTGLQLGSLSLPGTCDVTPIPQAEDGLPPFRPQRPAWQGSACSLAFTPTHCTLLQVCPLSPTHTLPGLTPALALIPGLGTNMVLWFFLPPEATGNVMRPVHPAS